MQIHLEPACSAHYGATQRFFNIRWLIDAAPHTKQVLRHKSNKRPVTVNVNESVTMPTGFDYGCPNMNAQYLFTLPADSGEDFVAAEHLPLVVYFYPKDSTPGCTTEAQGFRDSIDAFKAAGYTVVGISRDSVKSHQNFVCKQELNFPLLSDKEETVCKQFDVIKEKNMYGKKVMGIERSTFVIDANGDLLKEWRKVKVAGHVDEVLAFVQQPA